MNICIDCGTEFEGIDWQCTYCAEEEALAREENINGL